MTKSKAKQIINEFASQIEGQRWTRNRVNDLTVELWEEPSFEQGRIIAFCEVNNYVEPDRGEFATLEAFKAEVEG